MIKLSFCFHFSFDDDSCRVEYFAINAKSEEEVKHLRWLTSGDDDSENNFYDMISDNEEYGVHDYSTEEPISIGFCSYEVKWSNVHVVMNNIKAFFISKGFTIDIELAYTFDNEEQAMDCNRLYVENLSEIDIEMSKKYFWL